MTSEYRTPYAILNGLHFATIYIPDDGSCTYGDVKRVLLGYWRLALEEKHAIAADPDNWTIHYLVIEPSGPGPSWEEQWEGSNFMHDTELADTGAYLAMIGSKGRPCCDCSLM